MPRRKTEKGIARYRTQQGSETIKRGETVKGVTRNTAAGEASRTRKRTSPQQKALLAALTDEWQAPVDLAGPTGLSAGAVRGTGRTLVSKGLAERDLATGRLRRKGG